MICSHGNPSGFCLGGIDDGVIESVKCEAFNSAVPSSRNITPGSLTDKKINSGLDFEKSIPIITDKWLKENDYPIINEYEFNYIKFDESKIKYQFTVFLNAFKKYISRRKENPNIPENKDFQFCTLKYFLKELGL